MTRPFRSWKVCAICPRSAVCLAQGWIPEGVHYQRGATTIGITCDYRLPLDRTVLLDGRMFQFMIHWTKLEGREPWPTDESQPTTK